MASWLRVVVNDLQEIMLRILKDHIDAFILQYDLNELDNINMAQFGAQRHLSHGRLRNASVVNLLTLLIGLELLYCEFPGLAKTACRFVNSTISATTDEPDDLVPVNDSDLALVCNMATASIRGFYKSVSREHASEEQNIGPRRPKYGSLRYASNLGGNMSFQVQRQLEATLCHYINARVLRYRRS